MVRIYIYIIYHIYHIYLQVPRIICDTSELVNVLQGLFTMLSSCNFIPGLSLSFCVLGLLIKECIEGILYNRETDLPFDIYMRDI